MKTKFAIEQAGSAADLARMLSITRSAVAQWGEEVPELRVYQLQQRRPDLFPPDTTAQPKEQAA